MAEPRGIYRRSTSPFYYAKIRVWDNSLNRWQWRAISTRTTDPIKALATRAEQQALADLAHQAGDSTLTHEKAAKMAAQVLRWHGIESQPSSDLSCPSWAKFADSWLSHQKNTASDKSCGLYRTHISKLTAWLESDQTPHSPSSPLANLRPADGKKFASWLQQSGRAAHTTHQILITVRAVFASAIEDEHLTRNPIPTSRQIRLNPRTRRNDPFTPEDLRLLFHHLADNANNIPHASEWRTTCLLALCLGCRLGDATRRRWSEIHHDPTGPVIDYVPAKTARHEVRVRAPIIDPLLAHLQRQTCHLPRSDDHDPDLLTPSLAELPVGSWKGLSNRFMTIMKDSGITCRVEPPAGPGGNSWSSKGFHSFRHTLTSLLADGDVPEELRMQIVGHTQASTHQRYTHHQTARLRAALARSLGTLNTEPDPS